MATKTVNTKIYKQIGDQIIELKGIELEAYLAKEAEFALAQEQLKEETEAKTAQRQVILDRLGLTADEAQLLLG
jgi:hypothetical protein